MGIYVYMYEKEISDKVIRIVIHREIVSEGH